jgi:hypothetical protein
MLLHAWQNENENETRNVPTQVQGQFRESTQGQDMYIGMEVPDPVSLGVVTKALSRVILGVVCMSRVQLNQR